MNLVAAIITWVGCLAPYLSSRHQSLIPGTWPKTIAWSLFAACSLLATILLGQTYPPVAASLLTLTYVMTFWSCLILSASHTGGRPITLNALALGLIVLFTGVI